MWHGRGATQHVIPGKRAVCVSCAACAHFFDSRQGQARHPAAPPAVGMGAASAREVAQATQIGAAAAAAAAAAVGAHLIPLVVALRSRFLRRADVPNEAGDLRIV